jgi:hypothetical protein
MARLTNDEKTQLLRGAAQKAPSPPRPADRPARDVLEFATFASSFKSAPKPVRFGGSHWKL